VNKLIDTGAVAAAYWVADESIDAFRRFHAALYAQQPEETATGAMLEICGSAWDGAYLPG
jgi:protein-disulfide isomerase